MSSFLTDKLREVAAERPKGDQEGKEEVNICLDLVYQELEDLRN